MATSKQFRLLNSSGNPVTGQAGNLDFRVSPYGSGEIISGLTFTEIGTQGNYKATGIGAYYKDVKLFLSGTEQTAFGIQDIGSNDYNFVELTGNETIGGVKTFSSPPVSSNPATTSNELIRYGQAGKLAVANIWTMDNVFQEIPRTQAGRTYDGSDRELVDVEKLIAELSGFVGVVTSSQQIKLLPSRSINDTFSQQTLAGSISQLDTSSSKRGNIIIECINTAGNVYSVADDENWIAARIDLTGHNKPKIDLTLSPLNALSVDTKMNNIYLYYNGSLAYSFTSFKFENCDLYFAQNLTLVNPVFTGVNRIRLGAGKTLTLTNSTGTIVYHNDDITLSKSGTQCGEIKAIATADLGL